MLLNDYLWSLRVCRARVTNAAAMRWDEPPPASLARPPMAGTGRPPLPDGLASLVNLAALGSGMAPRQADVVPVVPSALRELVLRTPH
jgi:hypothetical protein